MSSLSVASSLYRRVFSPVCNYEKALGILRGSCFRIDHRIGLVGSSSSSHFRDLGFRRINFLTMGSRGGDRRLAEEFRLSEFSVLKIQMGDITRWSVDGSSDAIVNPANERMLGGGGADGAIHAAAGPELRAACYEFPEVDPGVRCPVGEARITPGFGLPASHVIHTVGPVYGSHENPKASLSNAYRNSLRIAKENGIQYIAFTAISCGVYGYPYEEAATVAISTVLEFPTDFTEVHFVLFTDGIYDAWVKKANELLKI